MKMNDMNTRTRMLVMMLLALFAWLLPQGAWAEDYVGNRSKYKVWIEGMNVIKAELPCYDQSGSDTWQTDGWLYYHIDGQAQSTRVAVINWWVNETNISSNRTFVYVKMESACPGKVILDRPTEKKTVITPGQWTVFIYREEGTEHMVAHIEWTVPRELRGKRLHMTWHSHRVGNGAYSDGADIDIDETVIDVPSAPEVVNPDVTEPTIPTELENAGSIMIPWMISTNKIDKAQAFYTTADGTEHTQDLSTDNPYGFVYVPSSQKVTNFYVKAGYTDSENEKLTDLKSNVIKQVPMIHAPIRFNAQPVYDLKGSVMLTWDVEDNDYPDLLEGDMFQIQRSLTGRLEDFKDLITEPFDPKKKNYSFKDSTLIADLSAEQVDAELGIPIVRYRIRRAATAVWGWTYNPTVAYEQPNLSSLHLLKAKNLRSEWLNQDEFTVKLDWDYEESTPTGYAYEGNWAYVWDDRAEMSVCMKIYNRYGVVIDSVVQVLNAEQRAAHTLTMTLPRPCVFYEFEVRVDAKTSPIGNATGNLYFKIRSREDFNEFARRVNAGETKLNAILLAPTSPTDNTVIGSNSNNPYCGIFEGNGEFTSWNIDGNDQVVAPFRYTGDGAVLRNIRIRMYINTSQKFASTIVGQHLNGVCMLEHCETDGEITSSVNGDGSHGGIVGLLNGGVLLIDKCSTSVTVEGTSTTNCGGFVGWRGANAFCHITNSESYTKSDNQTGCATFMRSAPAKSDIWALLTNCYYYQKTYGEVQGRNCDEIDYDDRPKQLGWIGTYFGTHAEYGSLEFVTPPATTVSIDSKPDRTIEQPSFTTMGGTQWDSPSFNPSMLFDNNVDTRWSAFDDYKKDGLWYVEFKADRDFVPATAKLTSYWDNMGNFPKTWKLKAKLKETDEWTTILDVNLTTPVTSPKYTVFDYPTYATNYYRFFRLEVTDIFVDITTSLYLSELALTTFSRGNYYFETAGTILPTLNWTEQQQSVQLQWETDGLPIDYFEVQRRTKDSDEDWQTIAPNISDTEYEDKTTSPVYTYYYRVRSVNDCEGLSYNYTEEVEGHCVQTGMVDGYVRFPDGTGIADVVVTVSPTQEHPADVKPVEVRTDDSGYYKVEGLRYYTNQSGPYNVSVNIPKDNLSADCADGIPVTFDTKSNHTENLIFTVTKGYRFSGYVMYNGTSIPVPGVTFTANNREVRAAGGPIETDRNGKFSFYLLGGETTIQAKKDGHRFYDDGKFTYDFTTDKDEIYFYDKTRVTLIGRIVGGKEQGELPLGNSLSHNNLGNKITMVMALEGDNTSWLVYDNLNKQKKERDTVFVHKAHDTKYKYQTEAHIDRHRIELHADPHTGEYRVELPPVKWKVMQIYAQGYPTLYQEGQTGDVIDLTNATTLHSDTLNGTWQSHEGNGVSQAIVEYHAQYNRIYHSPTLLTYKQMTLDKFDYFGDKQYIAKNLGGDKNTVPLAFKDEKTGETRYTFGHPVFNIDKTYIFRLSAQERYYWNNNLKSDTVDVVKLKGGKVDVYNSMQSSTHHDTVNLNDEGEGTAYIRASQIPYMLTGENALRTITMSLELDGVHYETEPLKAYVLNVYSTPGAKDILTCSTPQLIDILRDPPGGSSSAKISKGSTLKYSYQMDMSWKAGLTLGFSVGTKVNTFTGIVAAPMGGGGVVGTNNNATSLLSTSLDLVWSGSGQRAFSYTMTANEDISTSSHNKLIGSNGDVYIGMEQNITVKPATAIRALPDSVFRLMGGEIAAKRMLEIAQGRDEKDSLFHLVREEVVTYGPEVKSTFAYSQDYIVKQLLPNLVEQLRSLMFTGTEAEAQTQANVTGKPVYLSLLQPDDDKFATINFYNGQYFYYTSKTTGSAKGNSYKIILPSDMQPDGKDEVANFYNAMKAWMEMIAQNEKEKLEATELVQNFSVDGGSGISYSEDFTSEYSCMNSFTSPISAGTVDYFDSAGGGWAVLQVVGPVVAKLLGSVLSTSAGGVDTAYGQNDNGMEVSFFGASFKFSLTPAMAFNVVPKHSESKKFNRKESFTISMDRKSHIDFDVYRVKTGTDNVQNSGVMDVFTEDNFYDLVDYNEPYLKRELDMNDIRYARSFVYRTRGGATCRPYEGERTTLFYRPGTVLDERTKKIENPQVKLDKRSVSGVPYGEPARFKAYFTNESEQPEAAYPYFNICLDEASNPKGAKVLIDGLPLSATTRTIGVNPGEVLTKTIEVYAGEDFDYEDIGIIMISLNDPDTNNKATFSVHYLRTAGTIDISSPGDKWVMNTDAQQDAQGYFMPVVISGYNKNQHNFDHIEFQYKESNRGDDYWTNLCSFYANDSLMALASGNKAKIPEHDYITTHFYGEGNEIEKAYDLRAVLFCRNGNEYLTSSSKVLSGIKDTRRPQLFDTPQPKDGILNAGDNIIFDFSENIESNYLSGITNFEVMGETNESNIQEEPSLKFEKKSYAETEAQRNFSDKDFTLDMMIKPDTTAVEMPIFSHGIDGHRLQLWLTAEKYLKVVVNDSTYLGNKKVTGSGFHHIAMVIDNTHQQLRLYNDSLVGEFEDVTYSGYGPLIFGATNEADVSTRKHYSGRMLETRLWSRAMTPDLLFSTYSERQLTGYEMGLVDYYPMNEGEGQYLTDIATGAHAKLVNTSWALPRGMSLHLDWSEQKDVKGMKLLSKALSRNEESDYTLMFWFKTDVSGRGALLSNGSGRTTDTHARDNFFIGFEGSKLKYRTNGMELVIPGDYSDGQWHHYAMTVNRAHHVANIYLDRSLKHSFYTDSLGGIDGNDIYLGNMVWYNQGTTGANVLHQENALTGNIDELCLFGQALPQSLIQRYSVKSPKGDEKGLITYMGFNRQERIKNNDYVLHPYALNQIIKKDIDGTIIDEHDSLFVDPIATVITHIDQESGAPVQAFQELKNLTYSFVGRNNQLMVSLKENNSRINKRNVYVTISDIPDLNGNYMGSPVTAAFYVDRNPLRWEKKNVDVKSYHEMGQGFTTHIINNSGASHTYTLQGLPKWLTTSKVSDIIGPQETQSIDFDVSNDLNVGTYDHVIYLVDEDGMYEPLMLSITVEGDEPGWYVNTEMKHFSMNIIGQVRLGNDIVTDERDIVAAFNSKGQCLGKSNVSFNPATSQSALYLTVFDSTTVKQPLNFKLWHYKTGKTMVLTPSQDINFQSGQIVGSIDNPVIFSTGSSYEQTLYIYKGWNWVSLNVYSDAFRNGLNLLNRFDWKDGDIVTDDSDNLTLIYKNGQWLSNKGTAIGNASISPTKSYRIKARFFTSVEIPGNIIKQNSLRTITVEPGWNNIGYTPMLNLPIETALAQYYDHAKEGDVVKSQDEFAMFTVNMGKGEWHGNLKYMHPGRGYMLKRMGADTVKFVYPFYEPGTTFFDNTSAASRASKVMNTDHAHTMSLVAKAFGVELAEGDRLLAFVDNELCGTGLQSDSIFFISICGDKPAALSFAIERDGEIIAKTGEVMIYESNAVSGTPLQPTAINFVRSDALPTHGWYTLEGIKLESAPKQRGVYIYNGKKHIIR